MDFQNSKVQRDGDEGLLAAREQRDGLEGELVGVIDSITSEMTVIFKEQFALIRESFQETFLELFGGGKATPLIARLSSPMRRLAFCTLSSSMRCSCAAECDSS